MHSSSRSLRFLAIREGLVVLVGLLGAGSAWGWALNAKPPAPGEFSSSLPIDRVATWDSSQSLRLGADHSPDLLAPLPTQVGSDAEVLADRHAGASSPLTKRPAAAARVAQQRPSSKSAALAPPPSVSPVPKHASSTAPHGDSHHAHIELVEPVEEPAPPVHGPGPGGPGVMSTVAAAPVSTFTLATDTGSYEAVRVELLAGQMPDPATVQVEDFVNHFDYAYPPPGETSDLSVHIDGLASPWNPEHHLMRVGVQGRRPQSSERPPLHLTFLVDVSGSMHWPEKIGLAKQSMSWLAAELGPDDTVAIATYAGRVEVVLDPVSAAEQVQVQQAIASLDPGKGDTSRSGLDLAYDLAHQTYRSGHNSRVVVLSDGDANIGQTTLDDVMGFVSEHANQGIELTALGLGQGTYRDPEMESLAQHGGGLYHYIDSLDATKEAFTTDIEAHRSGVAEDVSIEVRFDSSAVQTYRLLGYDGQTRIPGNGDLVLESMSGGQQTTALYELRLHPALDSQQTLATVRTRSEQELQGQKRWVASVGEVVGTGPGAGARMAVAAGSFAEKLQGQERLGTVSYADMVHYVRSSQRSTEARDLELLDLVEAAAALQPPQD